MDATRSGAVLARHAGIGEKTGQLTPDDDDGQPRRSGWSSPQMLRRYGARSARTRRTYDRIMDDP